ncbi:MAG: hypothetical protein ACRC9N_07400 [Aeromonas sp.]
MTIQPAREMTLLLAGMFGPAGGRGFVGWWAGYAMDMVNFRGIAVVGTSASGHKIGNNQE